MPPIDASALDWTPIYLTTSPDSYPWFFISIVLEYVLIPTDPTTLFLFWYLDPEFVILILDITDFLFTDSKYCLF